MSKVCFTFHGSFHESFTFREDCVFPVQCNSTAFLVSILLHVLPGFVLVCLFLILDVLIDSGYVPVPLPSS